MNRVLQVVTWVGIGVGVAAALGFVLGIAVLLLWNWLMPSLFGLPEITYWQAVGLFILSHLLFKSHIGHGHGSRNGGGSHRDRFASKVRSLMKTTDERESEARN